MVLANPIQRFRAWSMKPSAKHRSGLAAVHVGRMDRGSCAGISVTVECVFIPCHRGYGA
jgi:hypothetical protein